MSKATVEEIETYLEMREEDGKHNGMVSLFWFILGVIVGAWLW